MVCCGGMIGFNAGIGAFVRYLFCSCLVKDTTLDRIRVVILRGFGNAQI